MADANMLINTLAKIMRDNETASNKDGNIVNLLYEAVNENLYNVFLSSSYEKPSLMIEKLNNELDSLKYILNCPEVTDKKVVLFSLHHTNSGFKLINNYLKSEIPDYLAKRSSKTPILIYHSEVFSITALNYNNNRYEISPQEYGTLVTDTFKNNIALDKIVRLFIVGIPMKSEQFCFIFDNRAFSAGNMFYRCINRFVYTADDTMKDQKYNCFKYFPCVAVLDDRNYNNICKLNCFKGMNILRFDELQEVIGSIPAPLHMGIVDEFRAIKTEVLNFYSIETDNLEKIKRALTEDIVNSDSSNENALSEHKKQTEKRIDSVKKERLNVSQVLKDIQDILEEAEKFLCGRSYSKYEISRKHTENVLKIVFNYIDFKMYSEAEKECSHNLNELRYDNTELILNYIRRSRESMSCSETAEACHDLNNLCWEKAKLYIAASDKFDEEDTEFLKKCVKYIENAGVPLRTGKELYVKALIANSMFERTALLKESFINDYKPASTALVNDYINDSTEDKNNNRLKSLANLLITEACMKIADIELSTQESRTKLTSSAMVYYKLLASQNYIPAIEKIVDIIYNEYFHDARPINQNEKIRPAYAALLRNLCTLLMEKSQHPRHYKEIKGIVLYTLKEHSKAMQCLSACQTQAGHYCRARMYQYGDGVTRDLEKAIKEYEKTKNFHDAQKQLVKCEQWLENEREDEYDSSYSYSSSDEVIEEKSSGCFITTAVCKALGETDDCAVLNCLRDFRDNFISKNTEGEKLIIEYYRVGPDLVRCIEKCGDANEIYIGLWSDYILPSCAEIHNGNSEKAELIYIDMVKMLCEKFNISVRSEISDKYNSTIANHLSI